MPRSTLQEMPRLIFANQLRGFAAISVALTHLIAAFWVLRDVVSTATVSPVQAGDPPAIVGLFTHTYLNFGPLGVGVFFLISGLVIPISLEQHTRGSFLLARLLRIYPTYIAALLIEIAVLYADAAMWGTGFPYGSWTLISNALLVYNTVGQPSIDLVNWTLCVELKFYVLMMLLAPQIRRGSVSTLLIVALVILAGNLAVAWPPLASRITRPDLVETFTTESVFIVFMLIGVLFNYHLRGLLRLPGFIAGVAALLVLFVTCWMHSAIRGQMPVVTVNYLYDVGLFAILYSLRRFARPIKIIDFLASISFPIYLLHSLVGYSVIKILMLRWGFSYAPAFCIAFAVVLCIATALHGTVELKTIALGKAIARRRMSSAPEQLSAQRATAI